MLKITITVIKQKLRSIFNCCAKIDLIFTSTPVLYLFKLILTASPQFNLPCAPYGQPIPYGQKKDQ